VTGRRFRITGSQQAKVGQERAELTPYWFLAAGGVFAGILLDLMGYRIEGGAAPVLAICPLFLMLDRRLFPNLLFGPLFFTYMFHLLGYALGPLWQVHVLGSLDKIEAGFIPAQWGGALGLWSYAISFPLIFQVFRKRLEDRVRPNPELVNWEIFTLSLVALGFFIIIFGLVTGSANRLGAVQTDVSLENLSVSAAVPAVQQVMFFFLGYLAARRRGKWVLFWLVTIVGYGTFYFLDGGRGTVALAALLSAMGYVWGGGSVRRALLVICLFALFFIPSAGVVLQYRGQFGGKDKLRGTEFSQRLSGFSSAAEDFSQKITLPRTTDVFFRAVTAQVVDRVFLLTPREIPFAGLEGIDKVPYGLVPKIFIREKPDLVDGNDLAIFYGAAPSQATGYYMPAVGDGYRRFGWPGVCLLYVFSAAIYAPVLAWCWVRRLRCEWLALLLVVTINSGEVFSASMLRNFYTFFYVFSKYAIFFFAFGKFIQWIGVTKTREVKMRLSQNSRFAG
jgi:hypothetical protein